jgi:hypothetical protein
MQPFIPKRFENVVFGLFLSGMMSFLVTGISNAMNVGVADPEFLGKWMRSWATSWAFAFPVVLFVAPIVRKIVHGLVKAS